jgi:predicted DCC family thiol-disulfide oxidoreductase YuxK
VRFVLAEAPADLPLRIAPLGGPAFLAAVPEERRAGLPSSLLLVSGDRLLTKSTGVFELMARLGGAWRLLGALGGLVPRPLRDLVYDLVVALRRHVFQRPAEACPLLPPELRERFDP